MAEITVNLEKLEEKIASFKTLQTEWASYDFTPPVQDGGGNTINQFSGLTASYRQIYKDLSDLMMATIAFLEKTREDYVLVDEASASKIQET